MNESQLQRFLPKLEVNAVTGCWLWCAATGGNGYGQFWVGEHANPRQMSWAHRVAYEHWVGPIPEGLELDHLCRNHGCVNPDHLEATTRQINTLRGVNVAAYRARQTHCKRGHEFTPENIRLTKLGQRKCRACEPIYKRLPQALPKRPEL